MNGIDKTNLTDQTIFRLNETSKIEIYQEINQTKSCRKKISKNVAAFDYIDKTLIVLFASSSYVCISSVSVVGAPIGIAGACFTLIFSLTKVIMKKLLSITRNKKDEHDKILVLTKTKCISSINWHGNKSWRIYNGFERER